MAEGLGWTEFVRIGRALGFPAHGPIAAGEDGWCDFADQSTLRGRAAALPSWLIPELIPNDTSRDRLRASKYALDAPALDPADALVRLHAVGDTVWPHVLARLLSERTIPRCVAEFVLDNTTFVTVGIDLLGFCAPRFDFADRPFVVVLMAHGDDEDALQRSEAVAVHECAHVWTRPVPAVPCREAFAFSTIMRTSLDQVPTESVADVIAARRTYERAEREANALMRAWGFECRQ